LARHNATATIKKQITGVNRIVPEAQFKGIVNERESQLRLDTSVRLRWVAVLGQLVAVGLVIGFLGFNLNVGVCLGLIALSAWLNVFLSIRYPARYRLNTTFATALLAYDILQLAALLYHTGGIQNPFVVLMIAPVALSAGTLPIWYWRVSSGCMRSTDWPPPLHMNLVHRYRPSCLSPKNWNTNWGRTAGIGKICSCCTARRNAAARSCRS
jgi:hypothetical protein